MPARQASEPPDPSWREVRQVLHEEVSGLPERYRAALVLCYLEGATHEAAAGQLKLAKSTLRVRLERGRALLRVRLMRRGLGPAALLVAAAWPSAMASASVPASVVVSTVDAASLFAAGHSAASVISVRVAALTEGGLKSMALNKLKLATAMLLVVGVVGGGFGLLTHQALADRPTSTNQSGGTPGTANGENDKKDAQKEQKPDHSGIIAAVSNDLRTLTVELPPQIKGDPPTSVEIKLTDKTKLTYFGVDSAGETPTVGYVALVWLVEGSNDVAAAVKLGRKEGLDDGKAPDFVGQITAVSNDGKNITLEVAPANKGDEPKTVEIKLTDKTKFSYFGVDQAAQTPTVGYVALVWLVKGSKDTAVGVRLGLKN